MTGGDRIGRYTVVSLLGAGGMGAVYRATDTTLGRDVALKVLPADFASDPERLERFRREARALASLSHPHVVTVHSVEEVDGVHFLTMELLTGSPLDQLAAQNALPIERVLQIGRAVADALAVAHDRGIVHRDLKPANVIVGDSGSGSVKVIDFGLAKLQPTAVAAGHESATYLTTGAGMVLGTPAYMSPEQVSGLDVDHRTDIFSLGVLLYEMATGVRPFAGQSSADLAASILRDRPRPASDMRAAVPIELADTIDRCLQKDKTARFTTMAEVRAALEPATRPRTSLGPSIAVLPFQNLSADPDNEFFGEGLAEEILNALAQIEGLRVAARTSAFSFKGKGTDIEDIRAKLKVATVLEGSVRRAGSRLRVTVQLVDTANGFQLWSERYDRQMADIFDVQDEIARAIAAKLKVTLAVGESQRPVKRVTENLQAYELHLRGRVLLLKRGRGIAEATDCFRRAVDLDPGFAAAWAGLADAYSVSGYMGMAPPASTMPKGLTAARRAIDLDPDLAEGHCALAIALLVWERDYAGADTAFRRCLALNPGYTQGRCWHAMFNLQWVRGRLDEGVIEARRALDADPLSGYAASILGLTLASAHRSAEAIEFARLAAQRDPDSMVVHWIHGLVAHSHGAFEESAAAFRTSAAISDNHPFPLAHGALTYAYWGKPSEALALHDELQAVATRRYVPKVTLAVAALAAGRRDAALDLVSEACDERDPLLILMARNFQAFDRLRDDPRFQEVLGRLAYPQ